jgi:hypothetical protein
MICALSSSSVGTLWLDTSSFTCPGERGCHEIGPPRPIHLSGKLHVQTVTDNVSKMKRCNVQLQNNIVVVAMRKSIFFQHA